MELGPEDVSLLERCPHFRGWYVQASMELGPEDVSLLERSPHFRGWYVQKVSNFQEDTNIKTNDSVSIILPSSINLNLIGQGLQSRLWSL